MRSLPHPRWLNMEWMCQGKRFSSLILARFQSQHLISNYLPLQSLSNGNLQQLMDNQSMSLCLQGSGCRAPLTEAEVASAGTAESMLNVTHFANATHAHQVMFLTLQILQREAFLLSKTSEYEEPTSAWRIMMIAKSLMFTLCSGTLSYGRKLLLLSLSKLTGKGTSLWM